MVTETPYKNDFPGGDLIEIEAVRIRPERISMSLECLRRFLKFHGIGDTPEALIRQFRIPGYIVMGRYGGDEDHVIEAMKIISSWNKGYTPDEKVGTLSKDKRLLKMHEELLLAMDGNGPDRLGRPWNPRG